MHLQKRNYGTEANQSAWLPMHGSQALGLPLVKQGNFAADMLSFDEGQSTSLHTHPGNHILFVVEGSGYLLFDNCRHTLNKGDCYFVPGDVPHQVGTNEYLMLLSIADDHRPVNSRDRLSIVQMYL